MLHTLGKVVRSHPRTAALLAALLGLAGTCGGLYGYALWQWRGARAAVREGRLEEAQRRLRVCLFVWPRSVDVHLLAARADRLGGDFEGAEAHLNTGLKLQDGGTDAIQLEFLLMRVQAGEVDEVAPALLNCVADNNPESPLILETLSQAYMRNFRYRPALRCLSLWSEKFPDAGEPLHWRGWVRERLNDRKGAMEDYRGALERNPDLVAVRLRVAEILLEEHRPAEALPHLERLRQQAPDRADVVARLGECRQLEGDNEEARRLLEEAVERLPDDAEVLVHLAQLDLDEGRPARAERWLRRVLKGDPTDPAARYTLVSCLRRQGREKEASAALKEYHKNQALLKRANKLLQDEAEKPTTAPGPAFDVGEALLRVGQERAGVSWLRQALRRDPGYAPAHRALAAYYEKKGDRENAEAHRRRLAELGRKQATRP
jgi:tetratricopeptide (TPR) repeat protein